MKRLTLSGVLVAVALILSFMERFIPLIYFIPIPGLKLGLANIVTLFALFFLGSSQAVTITLLRCLLAAFMFGGMSSLLYSITGALTALLVMVLMRKGYPKRLSLIGISIAGAAAHNTGQIAAASFMMKNTAVFAYLPVLLFASLFTGFLTALVSVNLFSIIEKTKFAKI